MKQYKVYTACLLLFLLAGCFSAQAQKETWNWTFGTKAGLTWQPSKLRNMTLTGIGGTPNAMLNNLPGAFQSKVSTIEGIFTMSDKEGNLLLYSDGMEIWNGMHEEIYAGLGGNNSSAQSGILLPYPGSSDKFICIGLGQGNANNMGYVVVRANSPGNVTVEGNRLAFEGHSGLLGEAMTAVKHADDTDWWIVAPGRGPGSTLNAWRATLAGIERNTPVKTPIPLVITGPSSVSGYIKFTPDGKHFAWAMNSSYGIMIGDFDNSTGKFSNIRIITADKRYYGVEFSPNQEYLYTINDSDRSICIGDFQALLKGTATKYRREITPGIASSIGALQLDPFGRIWMAYQTGNGNNGLMVIDNPDDEPNAVNLYDLPAGFLVSGTKAQLGLPSFSASFFTMKSIVVIPSTPCMASEITFSIKVTVGEGDNKLTKLVWNFGDGKSKEENTNISGEYSTTHTYTKAGTYILTLTPYRANGTAISEKIVTKEIKVNPCSMPVNPNIHFIE